MHIRMELFLFQTEKAQSLMIQNGEGIETGNPQPRFSLNYEQQRHKSVYVSSRELTIGLLAIQASIYF